MRHILLSSAAIFAACYAAPDAKSAVASGGTNAPATKTEPVIIGISSAVKMPENRKENKRGNKSKYVLEKLEIGQSLAIIGMKAENLTSTLSTANRNTKEPFVTFKRDGDGVIVHGSKEIKDANGNVTATVKGEPVVASRRVFFAVDCDPAKDPEKATVRIFRDQDKVVA